MLQYDHSALLRPRRFAFTAPLQQLLLLLVCLHCARRITMLAAVHAVTALITCELIAATVLVTCRIEAIDRLFRPSKGGKLKLKKETQKPVVLVLGTGWGAHSLVKVSSQLPLVCPDLQFMQPQAQQQERYSVRCGVAYLMQCGNSCFLQASGGGGGCSC
jgi:hypothetical protein